MILDLEVCFGSVRYTNSQDLQLNFAFFLVQ